MKSQGDSPPILETLSEIFLFVDVFFISILIIILMRN